MHSSKAVHRFLETGSNDELRSVIAFHRGLDEEAHKLLSLDPELPPVFVTAVDQEFFLLDNSFIKADVLVATIRFQSLIVLYV